MEQRNKARLTTGEIVEYDECQYFDPENPEPRKPTGNYETKYLGTGKIIDPSGDESKRLHHFWEYLNASKNTQKIRGIGKGSFYNDNIDYRHYRY